ncbi:ABC transporter permease, partial [uncultured Slackia sp.]|uniref:ABC transporter permease n=1 Tax=uncultured Slackia sp. TaxID=665903 RepID=UPI0025CEC4FE
MSVMSNFTLRSLAQNRARTIVSIVGIALSCALITAIFTTVTSLNAGLFQRTLESEGSWHIFASNVAEDDLAQVAESDHVSAMATYEELGSAAFSNEEQDIFGTYLTVKTAPTVVKGSFEKDGIPLTLMPTIEEGRMPESDDEIALPVILKGETLGKGQSGVHADDLQRGSTVTLSLGERLMEDDSTGQDMRLDSTDSVKDEERAQQYGTAVERLENTQERSYTVVGFYNNLGTFYGNDFVATGAGIIGITAPTSQASGSPDAITGAYLTTTGFASVDQMNDFIASHNMGDALIHTNLLRYVGITDGRAAYDTLFVIAVTLTAVIALAGISLIYISFSISVAERTRQFGMLSSIGASKRQLRRSVLFEALALGAIAIPLGIVLGLAGVGVTLHFTSDALGSAIALEDGIPFTVSPVAVVGCEAFSLFILLVSAWIPALRASRVSAVDAIRQTQDVRLTKHALKRQHKEVRALRDAARENGSAAAYEAAGSFALHRGIAGRLFGIPGVLATRSRERASSRGRTVVASLAVSVLLLIMCGSVKLYMDPFVGHAESRSGGERDISASFSLDAPSDSGSEDYIRSAFNTLDEFIQEVNGTEGVKVEHVALQGQSPSFIPAAMLDEAAREAYEAEYRDISDDWVPSPYTENGDYLRNTTTFYLDDATFDAYAQSIGAAPAQFKDPEKPRAIGLSLYRSMTL